MAEIRTRESRKTPVKTLDRAKNFATNIKKDAKITEKQSEIAAGDQSRSPNEYGAERIENVSQEVAREVPNRSAQLGKKAYRTVKNETAKAVDDFKQKRYEKAFRESQAPSGLSADHSSYSDPAGRDAVKGDAVPGNSSNGTVSAKNPAKSASVRNGKPDPKAIRTRTSEFSQKLVRVRAVSHEAKAVKTTGGKAVRSSRTGIRTAEQSAKASIRTSREAAKTAKRTAKATQKAAQKAYQASKAAAKVSAKATKAAIKATVKVIQAILAAMKSMIAALIAGGSVVGVVIIVICMVALLICSIFGIFFSGESYHGSMTMRDAISRINEEYREKINEIKSENSYNELVVVGEHSAWKQVIAVYAAYENMDMNNPKEVATLDEDKFFDLRQIFWDMTDISYTITGGSSGDDEEENNEDDDDDGYEVVEDDYGSDGDGSEDEDEDEDSESHPVVLTITIRQLSLNRVAQEFMLTSEQMASVRELLSDKYNSLWNQILYGVSGGDDGIVNVAISQIGNVGGEPYWSWYGFSSRVEWCCCFVSWCANECGYIDSDTIPMYSVVDDGVNWFRDRGQWLDRNAEPSPGIIIFFDWEYDGLDGSGDHTGIVEKVEDGYVYTIEGNASDQCQELSYPIGYYEILGYGAPEY